VPLLVTTQFPMYAILHAIIFATYIIGDIIAIPFFLPLCKTVGTIESIEATGGALYRMWSRPLDRLVVERLSPALLGVKRIRRNSGCETRGYQKVGARL
jgi:hypothetical protein